MRAFAWAFFAIATAACGSSGQPWGDSYRGTWRLASIDCPSVSLLAVPGLRVRMLLNEKTGEYEFGFSTCTAVYHNFPIVADDRLRFFISTPDWIGCVPKQPCTMSDPTTTLKCPDDFPVLGNAIPEVKSLDSQTMVTQSALDCRSEWVRE